LALGSEHTGWKGSSRRGHLVRLTFEAIVGVPTEASNGKLLPPRYSISRVIAAGVRFGYACLHTQVWVLAGLSARRPLTGLARAGAQTLHDDVIAGRNVAEVLIRSRFVMLQIKQLRW
jgi:hypothetical protein